MNIFLKVITSLGFLTVIIQFLGIPHSWKEIITVIVGVAVMLVAFFIDRITLFLQKREDTRYREEAPSHTSRQAVSPFSTPLSAVAEAFTETQDVKRTVAHVPAPVPVHAPLPSPVPTPPPTHAPVPHPAPAPHTVVPQSHTHVQEMARAFQRQNPAPYQAPATPTPSPIVVPVSPPTPAPKPIQASEYSSTPLSSLNGPAVALRIGRDNDNNEGEDESPKVQSKVKAPQKPIASATVGGSEKKKVTKKTKVVTSSVTVPVEDPVPAKPKSRKKSSPKETKEE